MKQKTKGSFFVIMANKNRSDIESYLTFHDAEQAYYEKYLANRDFNLVLTHLRSPDFKQISMAYSNYMLAMHAFFDDYRILVSKKIIECVKEGDYYNLFRDFGIYNDNLKCHIRNLSMEIRGINACANDPQVSKHQLNKWEKEIKDRIVMWRQETRSFVKVLGL